MENKDIHEWLLDEGIDSLTTIVNMKGESIFLVDVLEKHLKEQLLQTTVIRRSECCNAILDTDEQSCYICSNCRDRI